MCEPALAAVAAVPGPLPIEGLVAKVAREAPEVGADRRRMLEHRNRWLGVGDHGRTTGSHDRRFLGADRLARLAEPVAMIDVDHHQHRAIGIDDVHRIEPAAEPDLEDGDVERVPREQRQRRQRREFEVGQRLRFAGGAEPRRLDLLEVLDQGAIGRLLAVDPDPFVEPQQVGRGVATAAVASRDDDRLEHCARRTLAVGPADDERDRGGTRRGTAEQPGRDRADALEPQVDSARMEPLDPLEPGVERQP